MKVLGYRMWKKFPHLKVPEAGSELEDFIGELKAGFSGLILYHDNPFTELGANSDVLTEVLYPAAESRRCAVLIVSTNVHERPQHCPSPYIHFYSVSVPNVRSATPDSFDLLFGTLIREFEGFERLPNETRMKEIWAEVDPYHDVIFRVARLEEALYTQRSDSDKVDKKVLDNLRPIYGDKLASFRDIRKEYMRLCSLGALKKN